jgi:hypothetical protein
LSRGIEYVLTPEEPTACLDLWCRCELQEPTQADKLLASRLAQPRRLQVARPARRPLGPVPHTASSSSHTRLELLAPCPPPDVSRLTHRALSVLIHSAPQRFGSHCDPVARAPGAPAARNAPPRAAPATERLTRQLRGRLPPLCAGVREALPYVEIRQGQAQRRQRPGEHHSAPLPEQPTLLPEEERKHDRPYSEAGLLADGPRVGGPLMGGPPAG